MEFFGIIVGLIEASAVLMLGQFKCKWGFIMGILCNIGWITFAIITQGTYGLLIVCPVAFVFNILGFKRWIKDEKAPVAK